MSKESYGADLESAAKQLGFHGITLTSL